MRKVGYVYEFCTSNYIEEQKNALEKEKVDIIVTEKINNEEKRNDFELIKIVEELGEGDQLVVYELESLGKTIVQLGEFLLEIRKRGIELIVLNKKLEDFNILEKDYIDLIIKIAESEKIIISERTTRGLNDAKRRGRVGGRPRVSPETIKKIRYLYNNKFYTLREIAKECNVSIGTAYKYTQNE